MQSSTSCRQRDRNAEGLWYFEKLLGLVRPHAARTTGRKQSKRSWQGSAPTWPPDNGFTKRNLAKAQGWPKPKQFQPAHAANLHMFRIGIVTASRGHVPPIEQDSIRSDRIFLQPLRGPKLLASCLPPAYSEPSRHQQIVFPEACMHQFGGCQRAIFYFSCSHERSGTAAARESPEHERWNRSVQESCLRQAEGVSVCHT